jgi:hypothetical protein
MLEKLGQKQMFLLNQNTEIITEQVSCMDIAVQLATRNLQRDINKACKPSNAVATSIVLVKGRQERECFRLCINQGKLEIQAADTLGFVYGLYEISSTILGIGPFWFWNDQQIKTQNFFEIAPDFVYQSSSFAIKLRGWFVNDEVLIHKWSIHGRNQEPWEMVFEALLRCGGNMVIPGTDKNALKYRKLASDMGLMITHHHAEPLGAGMFAREYPGLTPSFDLHSDKFLGLWKAGIESQKGMHVIWNLGFRGQGDRPFWSDDPRYQTPEARGRLMGNLIRMQYDMVKEADPDSSCCTNLYGETMELYKQGYLKLPDDVIKIWADNGYGKMVSRRQGNHNPRIEALPPDGDHGKHGIYYHVSFYDLQAANHITMLTNSPDFVNRELNGVIGHGLMDYWIINCSNVKPHVYYLDLIATMWKSGKVDINTHRRRYITTYYGTQDAQMVEKCFVDYHKYAVTYGPNEDDHAGEQFANHVIRMLVSQFMKDRTLLQKELLWATDAKSLRSQVEWYMNICQKAIKGYQLYCKECESAVLSMQQHAAELMKDSILLQAKVYAHCFAGAGEACKGLLYAFEENYKHGFYHIGLAREQYNQAYHCLHEREHGKWHGFYQNECLTDIRQTGWVLAGLMSFLRNMGEGPHFFEWQREFLYAEEDRRVMLVLNMENHLTDDQIFSCMKERWSE